MRFVPWVAGHLHRLLTSPVEELNRAQRALRFAIQLARHCGRELLRDRAWQMAAALTYQTLFALVPIAILGLLAFRAGGGLEELRPAAEEQIFRFLGLSPDGPPPPASSGPDEEEPGVDEELRSRLSGLLTDMAEKASSVKFRSLGVVGSLLLVWGAFGLLGTVGQCFNTIYKAPRGRPWARRLATFALLLMLGPLLLGTSLYLARLVAEWLEREVIPGSLLPSVARVTALAASWLLLVVVYVWVPNVRVRRGPAAAGALVAAVLWEAGKYAFQLYLGSVVPRSLFYGVLGVVPLFLLWLDLTWMAVLFGLELTYTLQVMKERGLEEQMSRSR